MSSCALPFLHPNKDDSIFVHVAILRKIFEDTLVDHFKGDYANIAIWVKGYFVPMLRASMMTYNGKPKRLLSIDCYAYVLRKYGFHDLAEMVLGAKVFYGPFAEPEFYIRAINNTPEEDLPKMSKWIAKLLKSFMRVYGLNIIRNLILTCSTCFSVNEYDGFPKDMM